MKQTAFWREKKRRVYTMFKIFSTYIFIITNTMHTIGVDKITLFKTT